MVDEVGRNSNIIRFPETKFGGVSPENIDKSNQQVSSKNSSETIRETSLPRIYSKSDFQNDISEFLANPSLDKNLDKLIQLSLDEGIKLQPNPDNLKSINLETKGTDLVLNISQDHLKQGYMQVLSDLTLVAKFVDSKIQTEKMKANPFDSLNVVTRPDRNLLLSSEEIINSNQQVYEFGPEIKFLKLPNQKVSYNPYLVGLPRLEDVQRGEYSIGNNKQSFLESLALTPHDLTTFNPVTDAALFRKPILGADNILRLSVISTGTPLHFIFNHPQLLYKEDNALLEEKIKQDFPQQRLHLHSFISPMADPAETNPDRKIKRSLLDPAWSEPILRILQYTNPPKESEFYGHHNRVYVSDQTPLSNPSFDELSRQHALTVVNDRNLCPMMMNYYSDGRIGEGLFLPMHTLRRFLARDK